MYSRTVVRSKLAAVTALFMTLGVWPQNVNAIEVTVGNAVEITQSHRYCWFPTVHQFPTGEIMVTMEMVRDEGDPEGEFSAYCISKDGGSTWSRRYTMGFGATVNGGWSYEPEKDGTIWNLSMEPKNSPPGQSQDFHTNLTKWWRGGMEFQQSLDVPIHYSQPLVMIPTELFDLGPGVFDGHVEQRTNDNGPWGSIIHALNGDLLCISKSNIVGLNYGTDLLLRSTNEGKSWAQYSVVATIDGKQKPEWMGNVGPDECNLVRLADGRLLAVFRTDGRMGETWSSDDGKTWTPPIPTPFRGVCPRLRRLSNGMLALITGRPDPTALRFSRDGKEWTSTTIIAENQPYRLAGGTTHYADFIEVAPGKLFVVYDSVPYGWYPIPYGDFKSRNVIYGKFVDVREK